eukprot:TRINITY_DN3747_c0_g1_i2.p1 TRINITY_DN3747_c0_g1~~TRINITY_DN3747_c0_g1_i2.p1  ORF type:complete len:326 (+),score=99.29 TRINITY_DN3747_c0_g1_i2:40-1017(+)
MPSLAEKYSKWDALEDSDDDGGARRPARERDQASAYYTGVEGFGLAAARDLDAVSGPLEEVGQIREHFRASDARPGAAPGVKDAPAARPPSPKSEVPATAAPTTVGRHRPDDHFKRWDAYDPEGAILDMDNEGKAKPEDAPAMVQSDDRMVNIECVDYQKDRAEHDLDVEFDEKTKNLKQRIAYYFHTASKCKEEGNSMLTVKNDPSGALKSYEAGLHALQPCLDVDVLCAGSVFAKIATLACHLNSNAAQASLKIGADERALGYADAALAVDGAHEKSRYRRAVALWHLGRREDALEELARLGPRHAEGSKLRDTILASAPTEG